MTNALKVLLQMQSGYLQLESTLYEKYSTQTMIFWSLCAFIWFRNMKKMLLQMTSGFLQLESTLQIYIYFYNGWHPVYCYRLGQVRSSYVSVSRNS
jgi:uncharacterized membrane protein YobD (UPF0266 family)